LKLSKKAFYLEESESADRDAETDLALNHQAAAELNKVMDEIHQLKSKRAKRVKCETM
jgi:hypothetical protein